MLDLSKHEPVQELHIKLKGAKTLFASLSVRDTRTFSYVMKASGNLYPSTDAKYKQEHLEKMKQANLLQLKQSLVTDMAPFVSKALEDATVAKTILGETLPVDLDGCRLKLLDIKANKERLIRKLQEEIEELDAASYVVELMQKNARIAEELV